MNKTVFLLPLLLAGCAPGPDYVRPETTTPVAFKEAQPFLTEWQQIDSSKISFAEDKWWQVFKDPVLDALQEQVRVDNQNIHIAEAQYRAARAVLDSANAAFYPTISAGLGGTRAANANMNNGAQENRSPTNTITLGASASWEIDLWGRIRRSSEAAGAGLEASAADLAAARLSAHALLAQTYIQLRSAETQLDLQRRTVAAYTRYLEFTRSRYEVGVGGMLDVSSAESQLATARAAAFVLELLRAQYEHALAVLVGKTPSETDVAGTAALPAQPATPQLVPSIWLATRPDIVAAERRVAAANARIGVATAAWLPTLTLSGSAGFRNNEFADLIGAPHRFWSLGPALAVALFDGGARNAAIESAGAGYDLYVATYRQTVLTAFQEVEDNLAAARLVGEEKQEREIAARAARRTREIAVHQYVAGTNGQLEVTVALATELAAERTLIDARQRHLQAAVQLYKNLAGGPPSQQ